MPSHKGHVTDYQPDLQRTIVVKKDCRQMVKGYAESCNISPALIDVILQ